ncbi:hypothetical protein MJG53_007902 [Ovis ammon polii x Ovis aries]|uniref:Thymic stromal lymphopoietin n=2 Tax=Ovis TaxID=9935 RepID=A0A836AH56_SHEEP|nr:hypothetical protein JEQ12_017148 [Ovis aries]KAI4584623.1 hypothetical protein MJG53_007902 [Ovis ammon polii x Ovis aries]
MTARVAIMMTGKLPKTCKVRSSVFKNLKLQCAREHETSDGTAHESGSGTIPRDPEELLMAGERAEDFSSTGSWHDTKPQTWKVPEKPIFSVSGDSSAGPHPCEHHNPGFNRRTERGCGGRAAARPPPKGSRRLAKIFVLQLVGLVLTYNFTDCDFKKIKESYRNIIYQELNNYTKGTRAIDFDHFVYCEDQINNTQTMKKIRKRQIKTNECLEQVTYLKELWQRLSRIS